MVSRIEMEGRSNDPSLFDGTSENHGPLSRTVARIARHLKPEKFDVYLLYMSCTILSVVSSPQGSRQSLFKLTQGGRACFSIGSRDFMGLCTRPWHCIVRLSRV